MNRAMLAEWHTGEYCDKLLGATHQISAGAAAG
jgi:hypothetical protein